LGGGSVLAVCKEVRNKGLDTLGIVAGMAPGSIVADLALGSTVVGSLICVGQSILALHESVQCYSIQVLKRRSMLVGLLLRELK